MRSRFRVLLSLVAGLMIVGVITVSVAARQGMDVPFLPWQDDVDLEGARSSTDFPLYYAGESFEGFPLTATTERHQTERPDGANAFAFIYGDCTPSGNDGGCPPPLQIQIFPACERALSTYSMGGQPMPHERTTLRGIPAAFFENGGGLELYTRQVTVVIFGMDREQMFRAADALVPVNFDGGTAGGLPVPAAGTFEDRSPCAGQDRPKPQ